VNLRKLELSGFKTFARRTEVLLPGGVTGIVGPNGSGKSNLSDALRWVLGEQSLQHIRSKKTEDVIYAGGANRAPLGMAEVTITLDNTSGWIPLDFSEVTITRRAYRSGDNEYFINGSRVRLRDVIDLRNRAGFGQSSYSVIGQGLVDAVLSQRPEERRALFEEAAGIRHYQHKRDQTLDQLAATQQNLVRVRDIVAEIEPRLESLRRQSERARQHAVLSEELRTLQIRWYALRERQLRRQAAEAEALLAEAQRSMEGSAERLRAAEAAAAALEADRQAAERSLAVESQRVSELRRRHEQLQGQIGLAKDKLQFMQQQAGDAQRELADLAEARSTLDRQRRELTERLGELRAAEAELARNIGQAEQEGATRQTAVRDLEQRVQQARDHIAQALAVQKDRQREAGHIDAQRRDLLRQAQQHHEDMERKAGLAAVLAEKQADLQRQIQDLRGGEEQLSGEIESLRLEAAAADEAVKAKQAQLDALNQERAGLSTRQQLLRELQTNLEGLAEGARALLKARRPGILGSITEGLRVKPGYERAIAAALGHKLDAVLVSSDATVLEVLGEAAVTDVTLLPADLQPDAEGGQLPAALERAVDVVSAASPSLLGLLAGVAIAESLEQALAIRAPGLKLVTIGGDVVDTDGSVTRRSGVSAGEAILKRQHALDELEAKLEVSAAELEKVQSELEALRGRHGELKARLHALEEDARRRAGTRQQRLHEARDVAQQLQAVQAQVDWLASLKEQAEAQVKAHDMRRLALTAELDQSTEQIPELRANLQQREQAVAELVEAGQASAQQLADLRLQLGVTRQNLQHAEAQLKDAQQQLATAERQLSARQGRAAEHGGVVTQLTAEIEAAGAELAQVSRQLADHERLLPPLKNRLSTAGQELSALRERETAQRDERAELDKKCYRLSFDSQRRKDEIEALEAGLMEELQLTLDLLPEPDPALPEPSKRDVDAMKARLAGLGAINPGALDEYREVQERHTFLTTQSADLEGAAKQLQAVIAELEELTKKQFLDTFETVASEFERFFGIIFGGGQVQMFLTDPESINTSGIEILAQPPGKRLQSLSALSGGERALVAGALLFAILSAKPVPFCLLDEVDAALDEANVKRFCQALKSLAQQTQFVVITHNRETMAIADALYGVSMGQDGVSKLVSLRLPREDRSDSAEASAQAELELAAG